MICAVIHSPSLPAHDESIGDANLGQMLNQKASDKVFLRGYNINHHDCVYSAAQVVRDRGVPAQPRAPRHRHSWRATAGAG